MTNTSLARSYLLKAEKRLKILEILLKEEDYSDVVREAQEIVELALKGMLRFVGIEPPKFHDVGGLLLEYQDKYTADIIEHLEKVAYISKRKESFLFMETSILFPQKNILMRMQQRPSGMPIL